jgi:hypothetical protein
MLGHSQILYLVFMQLCMLHGVMLVELTVWSDDVYCNT